MSEIRYIWKPAYGFTPGRQWNIKSIILHSTDSELQSALNTLTGHHVSVHWLIDRDGSYYHLVDMGNTAWHVGKVQKPLYADCDNGHSIGIENIHLDNQEPWPHAQVQAAANLAAALRQRYGNIGVHSHAQVAAPAGRKVDPQNYDWKQFHDLTMTAMNQTWEFVKIEE